MAFLILVIEYCVGYFWFKPDKLKSATKIQRKIRPTEIIEAAQNIRYELLS